MLLATAFVGDVLISLFFAWALLLYWMNGMSVGTDTVSNIFLGIMLYGLSKRFFSKFSFDKEAGILLWVGVITISVMALQKLGLDPLHLMFNPSNGGIQFHKDFTDPVGMFNLKAHNGIFLALLVPILAMTSIPIALLLFVPIFYSYSSAAMLSAVTSLLFFTYHRARRWFYVLSVGLLALIVIYFVFDFKQAPEMYRSRWNTWHMTIKNALLRPIGYGPDSFRNFTKHKDFLFVGDQDNHTGLGFKAGDDTLRFIYYDVSPQRMKEINNGGIYKMVSPNFWDHPHNEYINLLFCFGIPGLALVFMFFRENLLKFMSKPKTPEMVLVASMLLVYAVSSITQFPLCVARLGYIFPILLGAWKASME